MKDARYKTEASATVLAFEYDCWSMTTDHHIS